MAFKWLHSKCNNIFGCVIWARSEFNIEPNLSIIGNVSKSTGVRILNGENDSQTPVQQAFLLQQRLTEVNHPDYTFHTAMRSAGRNSHPKSGIIAVCPGISIR